MCATSRTGDGFRSALVLLLEGCVERHGERRLSADQGVPLNLLTLPLSLGGQLEPRRGDHEDVGLSPDFELPLEWLFQLGGHDLPLVGLSPAVISSMVRPVATEVICSSTISYAVFCLKKKKNNYIYCS